MTIFGLRRHSTGLGLSPRRARRASAGPGGDTQAPSVPQNLVATAVSSSQINLTWNASTDNVAVTGYNIYRDNVLIDSSPTNSYADSGLAPGTEYDYEVSAFDAASNESARSAPDSATTHQVIVTAGLIAEWRFDDGAGTQLTDYSGNGRHGTLGSTTATPTWTATGLSFDGGDHVEVPSLPAIEGIDIVFLNDSVISAALVAQTLLSGVGALDNECGVIFGNMSGGIANEVITACQSIATGHALNARNFWQHASNSVAAGGWHLLQVHWNGTNRYTVVLDGTSLDNVLTNPMQIWLPGAWRIANDFAAGGDLGLQGDVAYGIFYETALSSAEQAQNRAALAAILAGRGITLP
jgi:Fibronectin type III domain